MKKRKKIISALCAGVITISAIYPAAFFADRNLVYAESAALAGDSMITTDEDEIVMRGTNSFGTLLADTLSEEQETQESNNGCNIFEVTIEGTEACVSFEATQDALIVAGIYTENGNEMLASGMTEILAGEEETYIEIETAEMPQYFLLRAFMVDKETLAPLCTFYESPNYTQEMQEFFAKTTQDFETDKVLNLDEDSTNNFAVYSDEVIVVKSENNTNKVVLAEEEKNLYIIENADDTILSLKSGDIFSYQYDEENFLIVKVKEIKIDGTTVTITGEDTSLEEVFEYVKIDSQAGLEQAEIDESTCDEGVIYNGMTEWTDEEEIQPYAVDIEGSKSLAVSYTLKEKELVNKENVKVKVSGGVDIKIENSVKVYISFSYQYVELKMSYSAKLKANISGKIEEKIKLGFVKIMPIPGVCIEVTPSFVVEVSAKIEISGQLKGSIGFQIDSKNGGKNTSSAPAFQAEIKVEGTIFIGLSLEPEVEIIDDRIASAGIEAKVGGEVKAEISFLEMEDSSKKHDCDVCLEGEIYKKAEIKFEVKLMNFKNLKFEYTFSKKIKYLDFYYSFMYDEFGWGTCPHYRYKTTITVTDKKKNPIEGVVINELFVTDENGVAVCYMTNGKYTLKARKDGYYTEETSVTIEDKGETVEIVMTAVEDGNGSGDKEYENEDLGDNMSAWIGQVISVSNGCSAAITEEGDLYLWGSNSYGQLGIGDETAENIKNPIKIMKNIENISLNYLRSAAITREGDLYLWGWNRYGQLGDGTGCDRYTPIKIMENVRNISLNGFQSAAITKEGDLYMWGLGLLGDGTTESSYIPIKIMENVKSVSLGEGQSAAITKEGDLYMWGSGLLGDGTSKSSYIPIKIMENVKSVSLGGGHSAAITEEGDLYMWGDNTFNGQLGDGTTEDRYVPIKIMQNIKSVSLGTDHSAAITKEGDLYLWGGNQYGQLGDGTNRSSYIPIKIMENVKSISLGQYYSAAITKEGDLYMWGDNRRGELGDGSTENRNKPIRIMGNIKTVDLDYWNTAIVTKEGDLYMWGNNGSGQLGDGTTENKYSPVKIMGNIKLPTSSNTTSEYLLQPMQYTYTANHNAKILAQSEEELTITSYTNLTPNSDYIFCQIKSDTVENILAPENLLYIAQGTADKNGNISFSYYLSDTDGTTIAKLSEPGILNVEEILLGDANNDGKVDSKDAVLLKKYLAGYTGLDINLKAADQNADGNVDSKDAVRLLRYLAGYDVQLGA